MQLFAGSSETFIDEGVQKHIAERLGDAFYDYYRFRARSGARCTDVVKNTYRVLLTRGMRGCDLCILDPETKAYVEERLTK